MKTTVITLALMLLITATVDSQVKFGIKYGVNWSAFQDQKGDYEDHRIFGLFVEAPDSKVTISFGCNFVTRSGVVKNLIYGKFVSYPRQDLETQTAEVTYKCRFIEFPLLIKYPIKIGHNIIISPIIGYSLSIPNYLAREEKRFEKDSKNSHMVYDIELEDVDIWNYSRKIADINNGLLFGLSFAHQCVVMEFRYFWGFNSEKPIEVKDNFHGVGITLGYLFNISSFE
ncbi:hypothetical protein ACFL67_00430 [candidate division KSB1 bacterium]